MRDYFLYQPDEILLCIENLHNIAVGVYIYYKLLLPTIVEHEGTVPLLRRIHVLNLVYRSTAVTIKYYL